VLVELLVLEEGLGVHDGVGALVALVGRVEVQRQVLHVLAVLLLAERVLEVLGDVELELAAVDVGESGLALVRSREELLLRERLTPPAVLAI